MRHIVLVLLALLALPAIGQAQTETIEYYATDAIGSIRVVFGINGLVLGRQDYDPFGRELLRAPALPAERFGGQPQDAETDQGYFHARQYQSRTGRFTRVDPIYAGLFEPQRWNRYAYVLNSPLRYSDSNGLLAISIDVRGTMPPDTVGMFPLVSLGDYGDGRGFDLGAPKGTGWQLRPASGTTATDDTTAQDTDTTTTQTGAPKPAPPDGLKNEPGKVTFLSAGGVFAPILGYEMSGGIYFDGGTGEWGVFGTRGLAVGLSTGLAVQPGRYSSLKDFSGRSITLNAGALGYSATWFRNINSTRATGFSAGPAPVGQKWGFHFSKPTTTVLSLGKVCIK